MGLCESRIIHHQHQSKQCCNACAIKLELWVSDARMHHNDIVNTFSVPLLDKIASHGDSGKPYVLENPTSNVSQIYKSLAETVVSEVAKLAEMAITRPSVRYDDKEHVIAVMDVQPMKTKTKTNQQHHHHHHHWPR